MRCQVVVVEGGVGGKKRLRSVRGVGICGEDVRRFSFL